MNAGASARAERGTPPTGGSLLIYGAGGHGLVVAEAAAAAGWRVLGLLDDELRAGSDVGRFRVIGHGESSRDHDAQLIVAVGDNRARSDLLARWGGAHARLATVIHPGAWVSPSASIGAGVFIGAGAVVNAEAVIADGAIVNSAAVVEHHCRVGACGHVAPGAVMTGRASVGARVLLGARSVVLPSRTVGDDAIVGAGAVVTRDVAGGKTVAGNPAHELP